MTAIERAKRMTKMAKMSRKEINSLAFAQDAEIRDLQAKLDEAFDDFRTASNNGIAAQSVANLRDIEVHENAKKYHRMAVSYHTLAAEKEDKLADKASNISRGLESNVDRLMGGILDAIGVKYASLARTKQKKLVTILEGICGEEIF